MNRASTWGAGLALFVVTAGVASAQFGDRDRDRNRGRGHIDVDVTGQVQTIRGSNNMFTLAGKGINYRVSYSNRALSGLRDLRPDTRVRVRGELVERGRIEAERIERDSGVGSARQSNVEAVGRVQSVRGRDGFTMLANNLTLRVDYNRRDLSGRPNVREDARVRVRGELTGEDRIDANQVEVLGGGGGGNNAGGGIGGGRQSNAVRGSIRSINREQNQMLIDTPGDRGGWRVKWDNDTEFIRNGRQAEPRDFRTGDEIRVIGRRGALAEIQARRIISGGQAGFSGATDRAIGEVVALDDRNDTMEVDFDGEVWTVRTRNAAIRTGRDSTRGSLRDLRLGQDVRVRGTVRGNRTVEATEVEVVRGFFR